MRWAGIHPAPHFAGIVSEVHTGSHVTCRGAVCAFLVLVCVASWSAVAAEVGLRAVFDEADAVVAIMERLQTDEEPSDAEWDALWNSEGYTRLLEREASMGRDEGFGAKLTAWLRDPKNHARASDFRAAVEAYRAFDVTDAGRRASAYLPAGVELEATFYPVIKHTTNTFVYDLSGDPAIFMTVDPANSPEFVESVLAHELHHVGFSQCPDPEGYEQLNETQQWVVNRLGVFGEGLATLATAGDPMTHPHFYSAATDWAIWERDVANVEADLRRMEDFFVAVLDGKIPADERRATLFSFIATPEVPQGPAYTLGWKMAALVERKLGRGTLVDAICDVRRVLQLYNEAARETQVEGVANLPLWSDSFLQRLYTE